MNEQPQLFDASRAGPTACPVPGCRAIRTVGQQRRIVTCQHDLKPADDRPYRRPRGCLNTYKPEGQAIPY